MPPEGQSLSLTTRRVNRLPCRCQGLVSPPAPRGGIDGLKLPPEHPAGCESLLTYGRVARPRPRRDFLRAQMRGHLHPQRQTRGMPGWVQPPGWRALRKAVFARWGHVCWRCGVYAGTVDHVVPVILGGGHDLANLRPACGRCNSSTGATLGNRLRGIRRHGGQGASGRPWRTSRNW